MHPVAGNASTRNVITSTSRFLDALELRMQETIQYIVAHRVQLKRFLAFHDGLDFDDWGLIDSRLAAEGLAVEKQVGRLA